MHTTWLMNCDTLLDRDEVQEEVMDVANEASVHYEVVE